MQSIHCIRCDSTQSYTTVDKLAKHIQVQHQSSINPATPYQPLFPKWIECIVCHHVVPSVHELQLHCLQFHNELIINNTHHQHINTLDKTIDTKNDTYHNEIIK